MKRFNTILIIAAVLIMCAGRCDTARKAAPIVEAAKYSPIDTFNALMVEARAGSMITAAEFSARLNQINIERSQNKKIQVVHPFDGHIYLQNQNNSQ